MAMHISEDIRPLSDLEENSGEILAQLRETGRPIVITVKGKAGRRAVGREDLRKAFKSR